NHKLDSREIQSTKSEVRRAKKKPAFVLRSSLFVLWYLCSSAASLLLRLDNLQPHNAISIGAAKTNDPRARDYRSLDSQFGVGRDYVHVGLRLLDDDLQLRVWQHVILRVTERRGRFKELCGSQLDAGAGQPFGSQLALAQADGLALRHDLQRHNRQHSC